MELNEKQTKQLKDALDNACNAARAALDAAEKNVCGMSADEINAIVQKAAESETEKIEIFPYEAPIDVARKLIQSTFKVQKSLLEKAFTGGEYSVAAYYSPTELRQIAKHLLVYCDGAEDKEDEV